MKIAVILGSVREGRAGERVARFVLRNLGNLSGAEVEFLDLKDYPLPFYAEVSPPASLKNGYRAEGAAAWVAKVKEADGFVIVTPEYNHGYPAVLKNALDYAYYEWNDKPVLFVSYSDGAIGGARSVEQLRQVAATLKLISLREAIHIGKVEEALDPEGRVLSGPLDSVLEKQLGQLLEWTELLRKKRAA